MKTDSSCGRVCETHSAGPGKNRCWKQIPLVPKSIFVSGLLLIGGILLPRWTVAQQEGSAVGPNTGSTGISLPRTAEELAQIRAQHDRKFWSKEVLAQDYERTFTRLWDELIHQKNKLEVLKKQRFDRLVFPGEVASSQLDWGIDSIRLTGAPHEVSSAQWEDWLSDWALKGYQLLESEWHHQAFHPATEEKPASSLVSFLLHITRDEPSERLVLRGKLNVTWATKPAPNNPARPATISVEDVQILKRSGSAPFEEARVEVFSTDSSGQKYPTTIHPIMLFDLNDDGLLEVIVGGFNRVYWNQGNWAFDSDKLCAHAPRHPNSGIFADFDGDGVTDYLCGAKNSQPLLYKGSPGGQFLHEPRELRIAEEKLLSPTTITAGDIDADGDVDVFIGQQKPAYTNGDMPTPYYNALDGFPSFLLLNDGQGNFEDVTDSRGLAQKRNRRMFTSSFVDLDGDGDLDLLTTSDFAGTDMYINDGQGHFTDVSRSMKPKGYAFGMSHTFGDYNRDGQLDFLLVGMSSTTARRLDQLGLKREGFEDYDDARKLMGYGNRLYLGKDGKFAQASFNNDVARTGWSWGSTTLDFDNDADEDIYVVNGQLSGRTTQDYCTRWWCHDVYYREDNRPEKALRELFNKMSPLFNGHGISWNGYEHNALLMNTDGESFDSVAFPLGIAHEIDCRSVASGDIDGDGRVDILLEGQDPRTQRMKLFFLRNRMETNNNWVAIRLRSSAPDTSPWGAKITVELENGQTLTKHCISGHSVWAQHANTIHFGIGQSDEIARVSVTWPGGQVTEITGPRINRIIEVRPPNDSASTLAVD